MVQPISYALSRELVPWKSWSWFWGRDNKYQCFKTKPKETSMPHSCCRWLAILAIRGGAARAIPTSSRTFEIYHRPHGMLTKRTEHISSIYFAYAFSITLASEAGWIILDYLLLLKFNTSTNFKMQNENFIGTNWDKLKQTENWN